MTYPQPKASDFVRDNAGFFRLRTALASPGDLYESDASGLALAVGPDSDIANIKFAYFDAEVPTKMQFGTFSPQRAFSGLVASDNVGVYPSSGRSAKILFWSDDLYDPNYRPSSSPTSSIQFVTPVFDVIQYFNQPTALSPGRPDKKYLFQNFTAAFLAIPYYGRKYCYTQLTNRNATTPLTYGIIGVNFAITDDSSTTPYHQETVLHAPAAVASNASVTTIITAKNQGCFDFLVFQCNGAPAPLSILMSDTDQG